MMIGHTMIFGTMGVDNQCGILTRVIANRDFDNWKISGTFDAGIGHDEALAYFLTDASSGGVLCCIDPSPNPTASPSRQPSQSPSNPSSSPSISPSQPPSADPTQYPTTTATSSTQHPSTAPTIS